MAKLFIIGNGFDCYCHGMKTKYKDFRDYIINKHPEWQNSYGVPEKRLTMDHKDYDYDDNEVAAYIIEVLDLCMGEDWSDLESSLGDWVYFIFEAEFERIDIREDEDKDLYRKAETNEIVSNEIKETFIKLKKLFYTWVSEQLALISYKEIKKQKNYSHILKGLPVIDRILHKERIYINFNYTLTLEKVYGIKKGKIWHIHGKIGDSPEKIYFGHGNDDEISENYNIYGTEIALNMMKRYFRKDTQQVLLENKELFKKIHNVTEIYSSGFSFSDVDMVYIDAICDSIACPSKVVWYFNTYDAENNKAYVKKIRNRGFRVKIDRRW